MAFPFMSKPDFRIERDSMGELKVPASALWGAQTQRAVQNFPISGRPMPREFIRAVALIKAAAARANAGLGLLEDDVARAIVTAADEVAAGKYDEHFPIDVFQTGSGTSTNMNANEVISHLAAAHLGRAVHANDSVNMSQSSNDVIPTAIHVSAALAWREQLAPALAHLAAVLHKKESGVGAIVKTGRTHLMDAMPVTFAQELAVATGVGFVPNGNLFEAIATQDTAVELSGQLKTLAVSLMKIANDLRWMNSGPLAGLGEIALPALQPGSSIMPGKVNPVIPEATAMVAAEVIGNDASITVAGQSGNFQLNVMLPLVGYKLLESIRLLANVTRVLADTAIAGFVVNEARLQEALQRNPILVTALNPVIGYEKGAAIAKKAYAEGLPILEVAAKNTDLSREQLKALLDPAELTRGGIKGEGGGGG
jgi:fumarate hydratase class II